MQDKDQSEDRALRCDSISLIRHSFIGLHSLAACNLRQRGAVKTLSDAESELNVPTEINNERRDSMASIKLNHTHTRI